MESLGLKNLALISPIWVDAETRTASLSDQITSYEREIRMNTFLDGDPNYSDYVDPNIQPAPSRPRNHGLFGPSSGFAPPNNPSGLGFFPTVPGN